MNKHTSVNWKSFGMLVGLQAQNSFNDKMAQFLIIPLAFWLSMSGQLDFNGMPHLLAVLIVLPYLLLAPFVGWLADRFAKTSVIKWSAILQTGVLGLMLLSVLTEQIWGAVACFFILSVQSTVLNPAKRGIIKELVGEQKLGMASGFLEMSVVLSVCLGQIVAGFWFAHEVSNGATAWEAMQGILIFLLGATLIPIILAFLMSKTQPMSKEAFSSKNVFGHFSQISRIWKDRRLRLCALGKSFFWFYAGVLNLWQISIAKDIVAQTGNEYGNVLSQIMLAASGGVILGGMITSLLSRRRVELGLLPFGGLLMLVGVTLLGCSTPGSVLMFASFGVAGFGGAVFLVPLNGQLQNLAPADERGNILAGASVMDCLLGLSAVVFQLVLTLTGVSMFWQCMMLAFLILGVFFYLLSLVAQESLRFTVKCVFQVLYRVRVKGMENIPAEGGVLLTPNHISYIDSLILSVASPRPVRFLMVRDCFDNPFVGWFARFADTIPISRERAKEAITLAAEALKEGTVVCIFPEGQLTRTGALCEMKRGYEMIARQAKAPIVPVYMDGLWGSLFSFEREKMFFKFPRFYPKGLRVHFGETLEGKAEISRKNLSDRMHLLSRDCLMERREYRDEAWVRARLRSVHAPAELQEMSWDTLKPYVFNAIQLREMGVFRDHQSVGIEEGCGAETPLIILTALLKGSVWFYRKADELNTREVAKCDYLFMGERLRPDRNKFRSSLLFDVGGAPVSNGELEPISYPVQTNKGLVELFSMPHPKKIQQHDPLQPGWKHNSRGRILPGANAIPDNADAEFFVVNEEE